MVQQKRNECIQANTVLHSIGAYLELSRVHPIVAFNEGVSQVVDTELLQPFQCTILKIQIVGIPEEMSHYHFR